MPSKTGWAARRMPTRSEASRRTRWISVPIRTRPSTRRTRNTRRSCRPGKTRRRRTRRRNRPRRPPRRPTNKRSSRRRTPPGNRPPTRPSKSPRPQRHASDCKMRSPRRNGTRPHSSPAPNSWSNSAPRCNTTSLGPPTETHTSNTTGAPGLRFRIPTSTRAIASGSKTTPSTIPSSATRYATESPERSPRT